MANPFLVLGGIAISVATAAFGILQVPGWVAAAQDASVINDLTGVRAVQAAATSQTGKYVTSLDPLDPGLGLALTGEGVKSVVLDVDPGGWCATSQSASGKYFATSDSSTEPGSGETAGHAAEDAGCAPTMCQRSGWAGTYYLGSLPEGPPILHNCLDELNWGWLGSTTPENPIAGLPKENYAARFTKTVNDGAGLYTFHLLRDDSARIFVDGRMIYEGWDVRLVDPTTFTATLDEGPHEFVVEYNQRTGGSFLELDWTVTR